MSWYNPLSWFSPIGLSVGLESYAQDKKNFLTYNGKTVYFDLSNKADYISAYNRCGPLKSIINLRAQMFVNGKVELVHPRTRNKARGSDAKQLRDLLRRPNIIQSWKQFFSQFHVLLDLYGYCPVIKIYAAGMPETIENLSSIWILPPWLFTVKFTGKFLMQTTLDGIYQSFWFGENGREVELDKNAVGIILDSSIGTDKNMNFILPDSRLKGYEYEISNITAALMSRNTLITKKGAIGILSNIGSDTSGPLPLKAGEREAVQQDFKRYGLTGEEWQVIITDASLKWQAMSFPTKDLMLFEEVEEDIRRLCDAIGIYDDLVGRAKASTFDNKDVAEKATYQNKIIPDAEARIEQFSAFIMPSKPGDIMAMELEVSYAHVEALQVSSKETATAMKLQAEGMGLLWELGAVTRLDILEACDLDTEGLEDRPEFNKYNFELPPPPQPIVNAKGGASSTPGAENAGSEGKGANKKTPGQDQTGI